MGTQHCHTGIKNNTRTILGVTLVILTCFGRATPQKNIKSLVENDIIATFV